MKNPYKALQKKSSSSHQQNAPFFQAKGAGTFFASANDTDQSVQRKVAPPQTIKPSIQHKKANAPTALEPEATTEELSETGQMKSKLYAGGAANAEDNNTNQSTTSQLKADVNSYFSSQKPIQQKKEHTHSSAPLVPYQFRKANTPLIQAKEEEAKSAPTSKKSDVNTPEALKAHMATVFATSFDDINIHTNSSKAKEMGALAYTQGKDIHFASGQFNPQTPKGMELAGHEFWHSVQQSKGSVKPNKEINGEPVNDDRGLEKEADDMGRKAAAFKLGDQPIGGVAGGGSVGGNAMQQKKAPIQRKASNGRQEPPPIQMFLGLSTPQWVQDGAEWVGDRASDAADWAGDRVDDIAELGADAFIAVVRQISPQLADMISQGPSGIIQNMMEEGIGNFLSGLLGGVSITETITNLKGSISNVLETVNAVATGDPKACESLVAGLDSIREMVKTVMDSPAIQGIQTAFSTVSSAIGKVSDLVLAPVFDTLMNVAGGVFDHVRGLATQISDWGGSIRDMMAPAWDWVMEQLGIGGEGEGGIWSWIKGFADDVWTTVKEQFAPIAEPLQTVGNLVLTFSPAGPFLLAAKFGPGLIESVQWLWNNKDNPDIIKTAHEEMGHTIIPKLLSTGDGLVNGMESAAQTLSDQLLGIGEGVLSLLGGLTGIPLLNIATNVVQGISDGIQDLTEWVQSTLQSAIKTAVSFFQKAKETLAPFADILCSLAMAAINPAMIPMILMGHLWQKIPNCFKPPIIDFLLDGIIAILEASPTIPFFGLIWPMIRSGVLGFFRGMREQDDQTKITITNKIAKILSGNSFAFIWGFVKGFLKGVWEGITDPFKLIYMAAQGLGKLLSWLTGAGEESPAPATPATGEAGQAGTSSEAEENKANLGPRMKEMAGELEPEVNQVKEGFMPALQEFFSGGEGMTFEDLKTKFSSMWSEIQSAIQGAGTTLANKMAEFFMQDSAEGKMGEGIGWLAGTIIFEVVLGILTAGTITAAKGIMKVVVTFAKVLDWTGAALGVAFKAIAKVGGFLLDLVRGLGKLVGQAGGAVKSIMDAIVALGGKLVNFASELLGRVVRKGGDEVAEVAAEKGAREVTEELAEAGTEKVAKEAGEETLEQGAQETAEAAAERGAKEAAEESGEQAGKEAGEQGARQADDLVAKKARELPLALAEAKAFTEANDVLDTPSPVLVSMLRARLMPRYKWIKGFQARSKGKLGHYSIHMIASDHEVDKQYTDALERFDGRPQTSVERLLDETDEAYVKRLGDNLEEVNKELRRLNEIDDIAEDQIDELVGQIDELEKRKELIEQRIDERGTALDNSNENLNDWGAREASGQENVNELFQTKNGKTEVITLGGGREIRMENLRAKSKDELLEIQAHYQKLGNNGLNQKRLAVIRAEIEKKEFAEKIAEAKKAYLKGSEDKDIFDKIVQGESNVWCGSREQAQRLSNTLEEIARHNKTYSSGNFHGPEVHVGMGNIKVKGTSEIRKGPREIHFNVKLKLEIDGKEIESHLYFPSTN